MNIYMSYIQNKRIYYINSRNRSNGTDSDFAYRLDIPKEYKFTHCCLLSAAIPKSYYLVSSGRNTFILEEKKVQANIIIPQGNYTATSFKTVLSTLLNNASPNGWTYSVIYSNSSSTATTGKYTFNVSGNGSDQPSFIIGEYLYEQLGFNTNTTYTFTASTLISANVIKMQLEDTLYLHSDIATNGKDDILNEIFVSNSTDYSTIKYQCPDVEAYSKEIQGQGIYNESVRFFLTNEDNELMNLNGHNIVIVLMLYRKDPIFENIKDYIKLKILQNVN